MKLNANTVRYLETIAQGPAAAGDFAAALSDADARIVWRELKVIGCTKLVRALWFNYETQQMRWEGAE